MQIEEMVNIINSIMFSEAICGLTVFACVNIDEQIILKKFLTNDKLRENIKDILKSIIEEKFISENAELDNVSNISDNRKVFYEIEQDDKYMPFNFINTHDNISDIYTEKDQNSLIGLLFKINLNDQAIWLYQHIYQVRMIKRSTSLYAMITKGDTYVPLDRDVLKIDYRVDILIIGKSIITSNISLMQQAFGFEQYIRSEAQKTIQIIASLDIISEIGKLIVFEDKPKLTNAKKLLKAKNSPVLKMSKSELINSLKMHRRYKNKFRFENDQIVVSTQKDVAEFIKMLNDDIVRSDLTNQEYDSSIKNLLEPLNDD